MLFLISCGSESKFEELEERVVYLEKQNKSLSDTLNIIYKQYLKPFRNYEKIVLSELRNPPNYLISGYEELIDEYPNSFWQHEARKRIINIESRKKFWFGSSGWQFPKDSNIVEFDYIENNQPEITCPGC